MLEPLCSLMRWCLVVALVSVLHGVRGYPSCCSELLRGKVCTLAGSGVAGDKDDNNPLDATFDNPSGVTLFPPDRIVVGGYNDNRIRCIYGNGSVGTLAGAGGTTMSWKDADAPLSAKFARPCSVAVDTSTRCVFVSDEFNHRIRIINRNGSVGTVAGSGAIGFNGGGFQDDENPLAAMFYFPAGIAVDSRGFIIVGGNYDQRIRVIYPNHTVSTLAGTGGFGKLAGGFRDSFDPLDAVFSHPFGVALDGSDNIIVADMYGNRIRKVWRDGTRSGVSTIAGCGPVSDQSGFSWDDENPLQAKFFTPSNIAFDPDGNLVISSALEHRLRILFVNGSVRTLSGLGPYTVSKSTTGSFTDLVPLSQAGYNNPQSLFALPSGVIVLADFGNNRIRQLCRTPLELMTATPSATHSEVSKSSHPPTASRSFPPTSTNRTATPSSLTPTTREGTRSPTPTPSISMTLTPSISLGLVKPLPPAPGAAAVISKVVGEQAATAFVASGSAASGVGSVVLGHPATASVAVRSGLIAASVDCALAGGGTEPDSLQYPATFDASGSSSVESESGARGLGEHSGGVVCVCALFIVLQCFRMALCRLDATLREENGTHETHRSNPSKSASGAMQLLCGVEAMALQYYVPSVAFGTAVVARHSSSASAVALCAVSAFGVVALVACRAYTVLVDVPRIVTFCRLEDGVSGTVKASWSGPLVTTHGAYFTGARDGHRAAIRLAYFVELLCSAVMGCIGGWRPSQGSCVPVASLMLLCTVVLLGYSLALRPYERRLETWLSVTFAVGQVGQAVCSVVVTSSPDSPNALLALSWVTVTLSWGLLFQLCVVGGWACVVTARRRQLRRLACESDEVAAGASPSPLLMSPIDSTKPPLPGSDLLAIATQQ